MPLSSSSSSNLDPTSPSPWLRAEQEKLNILRAPFNQKNNSNKNNKKNKLLDLAMAAPFELWPENNQNNQDTQSIQNIAFLIHGFLGTPYFMRATAEIYARAGFYAYAALSPGHGICPKALKCFPLKAILNALTQTLGKIHAAFPNAKIHLCGFSLGGLLALQLAQKFPIESFLLFAPALKITPLAQLIPLLDKLGLADFYYPSAAQLNGHGNPVMYEYYPLCAVRPILEAIHLFNTSQSMRKNLSEKPIYLVGSEADAVVKLAPMLNLFQENKNKYSRFYLYGDSDKNLKNLNAYKSYINLANQSIDIIPPFALGPNIKNMSHVALGIRPEDPILGRDGLAYQNLPLHYQLGETLTSPSVNTDFFRLFFNPDFDTLSTQISHFLKNIIS